ncbi:hypothetical protein Hypma_005104 [Hypsizygus marmoreus]|uniref:Protein kinase domain-containing protein n=1 Tax=Hypsizygus marmoreus TaxID=39966 RepID=A0A369K333_HYPMA|nr:hypothetical protein Hypma_005104 [Hypsizygus marmoreus]
MLRIEFLPDVLYTDTLPLVEGILQLKSTEDTTFLSGNVQTVKAQECIWKNNHSTVFLASLDDSTQVALKFALDSQSRSDLDIEAKNYGCLRKLEGSVVPIFYGLFKAQGQSLGRNDNEIFCIMLEYCGERLPDSIENLLLAERRKIFTLLGELHRFGYDQKAFGGANIVVQDGKYRLIDLHSLVPHACQFNGDWKWDSQYIAHIGCDVLEAIGEDNRVWSTRKHPRIKIGHKVYSAFVFPSQEFIDTLVKPYISDSRNFMKAQKWMRNVRIFMDYHKIPVENDVQNEEVLAFAHEIRPEMRRKD